MSEFFKQRICIEFCFKLAKGVSEIYKMIKTTFGDSALSRSRIFEWFAWFKEGQTSVEDDKCSGCPTAC